jgi:hypothetical protein
VYISLHYLHTQQLASLLKQHGVSQDATVLAQSLGIATPPAAADTTTTATPSNSSARRSSNSSSRSNAAAAKQLQRRHSTPTVSYTNSSSTASNSSGVRSSARAPKTLDYTHLVNADNSMNTMQQQQQNNRVGDSPRGAPAYEPATPTVRRIASSNSSVSSDVKGASSSVTSKGRRVTPVSKQSKQQRAAAVASDRTPVSSVSSIMTFEVCVYRWWLQWCAVASCSAAMLEHVSQLHSLQQYTSLCI